MCLIKINFDQSSSEIGLEMTDGRLLFVHWIVRNIILQACLGASTWLKLNKPITVSRWQFSHQN